MSTKQLINKIHNIECVQFMEDSILDKSIDLIIEDRPYGKLPQNKVKWDKSYKIDGIFEQYKRILKDNGQLVIWGQQPMLSFVLIEALDNDFDYRFEEIWEKPGSTWSSNSIPLKVHEQFIVFKKHEAKVSDCIFNLKDVMGEGVPYYKDATNWNEHNAVQNLQRTKTKNIIQSDGERYPRSVLKAPSKQYMKMKDRTSHPTQKSQDISDWQIKGLSNKDSLVYIPFAGSGTEIISCIKYNRNWIATELNNEYINDIITPRINTYLKSNN